MRLYVGNLSFQTSENDLQDAFGRFGSVTDSKIVTDFQTGQSRGFAFVTMGNTAEGQAAIAGLNGGDLGGRNLTVNEARPREDRGGGAGNGANGGGGKGKWEKRPAGQRRY